MLGVAGLAVHRLLVVRRGVRHFCDDLVKRGDQYLDPGSKGGLLSLRWLGRLHGFVKFQGLLHLLFRSRSLDDLLPNLLLAFGRFVRVIHCFLDGVGFLRRKHCGDGQERDDRWGDGK